MKTTIIKHDELYYYLSSGHQIQIGTMHNHCAFPNYMLDAYGPGKFVICRIANDCCYCVLERIQYILRSG